MASAPRSTAMLVHRLSASVALLRRRAADAAVSIAQFSIARPTGGWLFLCCLIAFVVAGLPLLRAPEWYIATMVHDTLFIADLGYRLAGGQIPHVDFSSAFGIAFIALIAAGVKTGVTVGEWLRNASWLSVAVMLPAILYVARTRLSNGGAFLFIAICVLTLVVPVNIGVTPNPVTYAMFYNRVAYVLLLVLIVLVLGETSPAAKRSRLDAALAAAIAVTLIYTKANYGAFAFLLLLMWGGLSGCWSGLVAAAILLAGTALLLEWVVGPGINLAYLDDLRLASGAGGTLRLWYLKRYLGNAASGSMTEIMLAVAVIPAICLRLGVLKAKDALSLGLILVIGVFLIAQNSQDTGLYVILAPSLVLLARWRDPREKHAPHVRSRDDAYWLAGLVVAVFCLAFPYLRTPVHASLAQLGSIDGPEKTRKLRVTGIERLHGLVLQADGNSALLRAAASGKTAAFDVFGKLRQGAKPATELGQDEYLEVVRDGLSILENCPRDRGILTLDFGDPFPLLRSSPQLGGIVGFQYKRTFSERAFPAASRLFERVDCVMIPKLPVSDEALKVALDSYGAYIEENFKDRYESSFWTLVKR